MTTAEEEMAARLRAAGWTCTPPSKHQSAGYDHEYVPAGPPIFNERMTCGHVHRDRGYGVPKCKIHGHRGCTCVQSPEMHHKSHYGAIDDHVYVGDRDGCAVVPVGETHRCGRPASEHHSPAYGATEENWCECDWLGAGTPRHAPSAMCRALRPDANRSSQ